MQGNDMTDAASNLTLERESGRPGAARSPARRAEGRSACALPARAGGRRRHRVRRRLLRGLIAVFHNASFYGVFNFRYDANILEGPSPFGDFLLLSPIIGGLIVVWIVENFAPEAKGHGVPEVMDSIFYKDGNIRWQVAVVKSLASALSIGTGAAVGREGPIIQIGAALGSAFSQAIRLAPWQKVTLLSAGAGAGIAATFNTPLGGVLFALEILLPEVSNRTFLPVVIATGAATQVGRMLIGPDPAFKVPEIQFAPAHAFNIEEGLAFVLLGVLCGLASWAFIRLLEGRIVGLVPPRSGLWREARIRPDALIDPFVEIPPAVCGDTDPVAPLSPDFERAAAPGAAIVFHGVGSAEPARRRRGRHQTSDSRRGDRKLRSLISRSRDPKSSQCLDEPRPTLDAFREPLAVIRKFFFSEGK